jgi:hypothetical protein
MATPPTTPSIEPDQVPSHKSTSSSMRIRRASRFRVHHLLEGNDLTQLREDARLRMAKTTEALGRPVWAISHEPHRSWSRLFVLTDWCSQKLLSMRHRSRGDPGADHAASAAWSS